MSKGSATKSAILVQALNLVSEVGLEGLTVGVLAKRVGMSKSGLYAHFESKEDLQCQVLDAAAQRFVEAVLSRAFMKPRGLLRVRALFEHWLDWWASEEWSGGCPFVAAAFEYDDKPGPVRDVLVDHLGEVTETIAGAAGMAMEEGQFRGDLDVDQFAFEFWAILMAYHHASRLMRRPNARTWANQAFDRLVRNAAGK